MAKSFPVSVTLFQEVQRPPNSTETKKQKVVMTYLNCRNLKTKRKILNIPEGA